MRAAVLWIAEVQRIRSEIAGATRGAGAGEANPPAAANPGLAETLVGCGGGRPDGDWGVRGGVGARDTERT